MADFDIITAGERRLQALFENFPERLDARLYAAMERIADRLWGAVVAAEPQSTGRLRSETAPFVNRTPNAITAGVSIRVGDSKTEGGKAAALEYGAHRLTTVSEHWAVRSDFFGRFSAPQNVFINEYRRRVDIQADRYLRGPFEAMRGEIVAELQAAVDETVAEP